MVIIGIDRNACVSDAAAMNLVIGKYGIGVGCANEKHLFRFAEQHEFFVANICFRYWKKRKMFIYVELFM